MKKTDELLPAVRAFNLDSIEELAVQVGMGNISAESVVPHVVPEAAARVPKEAPTTTIGRLLDRVRKRPAGVVVDGLDGVKHTIAKCCSPVPGEAIVGFVTAGHDIAVHRRGCLNTLDLDPERAVEVRWGDSTGAGYPVAIRVFTETGVPGLLTRMTKIFSDMKLNIDAAICTEAPDGRAENLFRFHAKNLQELTDVVRKFESMKGVHSVARVRD
jgi:GTP pyrophosphokinase